MAEWRSQKDRRDVKAGAGRGSDSPLLFLERFGGLQEGDGADVFQL